MKYYLHLKITVSCDGKAEISTAIILVFGVTFLIIYIYLEREREREREREWEREREREMDGRMYRYIDGWNLNSSVPELRKLRSGLRKDHKDYKD